jgi:polysaccharide pyruvyl transferase WcaK-like protein
MNVLLVNDCSSNPNWGDRAAAVSLMAMVTATGGRIVHAVTEDELISSTFVENAAPSDAGKPSTPEHFRRFIPPVVYGVARRLRTRSDDAGPGRLIPERWDEFEQAAGSVLTERGYGWPELLEAIDLADVVVIHGGCLNHGGRDNAYGILPRTYLFLAYLAKVRFGKRVIIVNHTADIDHPDLRRMVEGVYALLDDVVFRDPISAERCASWCGGRFAPDTAFWFEPAARARWAAIAGRPTYFDVWPHRAAFDPSLPYLCIGGSSSLPTRWRPQELAQGFRALIEAITTVYSGQLVLTASDDMDQVVFEPLAATLSLPLVGVTTPIQQAVDILGNADAYVGGRWHSGIFALRGGVPVIALSSTTFKMQALMRSAGLPETPFDALELSKNRDSVAQSLLQFLEGGDELRDGLRVWAARQAECSWDNVTYLRRHG